MQKFKVTIEVEDDTNISYVCSDIEDLYGVTNVSKPELIEPEWKQKVREIITPPTTIDDEGRIHGRLYTTQITDIIKAGGLLMVRFDNEIQITNWEI